MNPPHYIRKYVSSDHVKTGDYPSSMAVRILKKDVSAVSQISNGDFLVKNTGTKARIFYE